MANVRFENITVKYGNHCVLKDLSLEVESGQIMCLVGPSGCGKTTLVRALLGLNKPETGAIYVGDRCLYDAKKRVNVAAEKRNIGIVFQDYAVWPHMTVLENVSYPLKKQRRPKEEIKARAMKALEQVHMVEYANHLPSQLSGGQQQRVAIARALATNPKIILCDEATSALDPQTTTSILNLLKEINRTMGITVVIITHEMSVVESICSHVAIIDNGELAEYGTVEDIFSQPKSLAAQKLIFRKAGASGANLGDRLIRIVFEGNASSEPVIASLVLECHVSVNIMYADTRDVNGKAFGQMILQLPDDRLQQEKVIFYLQSKGMRVEEVNSNGH